MSKGTPALVGLAAVDTLALISMFTVIVSAVGILAWLPAASMSLRQMFG